MPHKLSILLDDKPRTRGECRDGERPCPYVSCRYHLYLDVSEDTGSLKENYVGDVWEMPETCALDVADRGGVTLEDVGRILGLTRERIRQIEVGGLHKLRAMCRRCGHQKTQHHEDECLGGSPKAIEECCVCVEFISVAD